MPNSGIAPLGEPLLVKKHEDEETGAAFQPAYGSSFWQATFNSLSLLFGIGMLSTPFALQQGGWIGIGILLFFAITFCYTAYQLGCCISISESVNSYQEIGGYAFGWKGRATVTCFLYVEICAVLVGYTISVGDNLAKLFPAAALNTSWINLGPSQLLSIIAILFILPTVLIRDLRMFSYLSVGGVVTYMFIVFAVIWAGLFEGIGFKEAIPAFRVYNILTVTGIYAYCYSGHVIFPSICASMRRPSQYPKMLFVSFVITTAIYAGFAFLGARMFGDDILSQITLNMPANSIATKIAQWVIVITPITKYGLGITPVALEFEKLIPWTPSSPIYCLVSIAVRSSILLAILALALAVPYFENVLAFIGSALSISMSMIFPCVFYVKIFYRQLSRAEKTLNIILILVGVCLAIMGTIRSLQNLTKGSS